MRFPLSLDRNAEITIAAKINIKVDPDPDPPAADVPVVTLTATIDRFISTHTGASKIMYTLPADKMVDLQIAYTDARGNPATVDGAVTWESSDPNIASIQPSAATPPAGAPEGSVVTLVPGDTVGNCQITASADADLGEGIRELVTLLDVTVVAGEAVAGTITPAGEAVPIP